MAEASRVRPTIRVQGAIGGWPAPWPNVEELSQVLRADEWTLIGGLMAQLHAINRGLGVVRPTNDVDIVLHIETSRGVPARSAAALESIGYRLVVGVDPRRTTAHRFTRGTSHVDLLTGSPADVVDLLIAEHAAPSVEERLRGKTMVKVQGGTQALRRTVNAVLEITPDVSTTISVPGPFGALILKAAAYQTDSRDHERHLYDAAALLACIEDPYAERESFAGSDRSRIRVLEEILLPDHNAWLNLPGEARSQGQAALRLLSAPTG